MVEQEKLITIEQATKVQTALDNLAMLLVHHGHIWTPEDRQEYEQASNLLNRARH